MATDGTYMRQSSSVFCFKLGIFIHCNLKYL